MGTRQWDLDYKAFLRFRDAQFEQFKRTEEHLEKISKILKQSSSEQGALTEDETEEFLREFYSEGYMSLIFTSPYH